MDGPKIIAFSRGFHRKNINGKNIVNKDYDLKINPNNHNKIHLKTKENDKKYRKIYDSPNSFIKTFVEKQSLFDMIRHEDNLIKPKEITRRYSKLDKSLKGKKVTKGKREKRRTKDKRRTKETRKERR